MYRLGLKYGSLASVIIVSASFLAFLLNKISNTPQWPVTLILLTSLFFTVFLIIKAIIQFRKQNADKISFSQAFQIAITATFIISLIYPAYLFFLNNVVDTSLAQKRKMIFLEKTSERLENKGYSSDEAEEMILPFRVFDFKVTPLVSFLLFLILMAISSIFSLILASVIKKDLNNSP